MANKKASIGRQLVYLLLVMLLPSSPSPVSVVKAHEIEGDHDLEQDVDHDAAALGVASELAVCANSVNLLCDVDSDCCDEETQMCIRGQCQPRHVYDFEILGASTNGGSVIAQEYDNPDFDTERAEVVRSGRTHFPTVIRIPDWVPRRRRAHPRALFYMYYGKNGGVPSSKQIYLKWARQPAGPWRRFDLGFRGGFFRRGVLDFGDDADCQRCRNRPRDYPNPDIDRKRSGYRKVTAPDVVVDNVNQRFILFYYAETQAPVNAAPEEIASFTPQNKTFVAFSRDGLNFNDPDTGAGQGGYGPRRKKKSRSFATGASDTDIAASVTDNTSTQDVPISGPFHRTFFVRGQIYAITERGTLYKPRVTDKDALLTLSDSIFDKSDVAADTETAWQRQSTPSPLYNATFSTEYKSAIADFFASQEFIFHPNNENYDDEDGGRFPSHEGRERVARPSISAVMEDKNQVEVLFWITDDPNDRYPDLYRVLLDVSSQNFDDWTLVRDATTGHVVFDTVMRPSELHRQIRQRNQETFSANNHADPRSFGDSFVFRDELSGDSFLFYTYVSHQFRGRRGDGQISSVKIMPSRRR